MSEKKFLWTEKYRPQGFDDVIMHASLKNFFDNISDQIPNMIFHGPPGTGKSTIGFILGRRLDADTIIINGSSERNIDTLRSTIREFASTVTLDASSPHKLIIIEESDYTNQQSFQPALRRVIEEYADNCRFIFTCNYLHKMIEPLRSRTTQVNFNIPPAEKVSYMGKLHGRMCQILDIEGVPYDPKAVADRIYSTYPDNRQLLNSLQSEARTYGNIDSSNETEAGNLDRLVNLLASRVQNTSQKFSEIRKWIINNPETPAQLFTTLYKRFAENSEYMDKLPHIVLIIAEYQYKSAFAADQELNTTAALVEISGLFDE